MKGTSSQSRAVTDVIAMIEAEKAARPHLGEFREARQTKKKGRQSRPAAIIGSSLVGRWDAQGRASRGLEFNI